MNSQPSSPSVILHPLRMAVSTSSVGPGRLLRLNQRPLFTRAVPPSFIPYRPAASTSRTHTPTISCSSAAASSSELSDVTPSGSRAPDRTAVRLGLPSKGRMAALNLLKNCQLSVWQVNPRQYVADIPQIANLEVWYQRPKDIVRKLRSGDLDLGIVGFDTLSEYGEGNEDLIIVHDALDYGDCRLSIAIPMYGIFENINSVHDLAQMPQWTKEKPLRIATGFTYMGLKFTKEIGLNYVSFSTADGALEAAPAMGIADAILDLVSSGTTLRENNLKEIEGGIVLQSQAVLVASKKSLIRREGVLEITHEIRENNLKEIEGGIVLQSQAVLVASKKSLIRREGVLEITHEILERLEAHLRATGQFMVTANMRGRSEEEVAERILSQSSLSGLQGPTISPVFHDYKQEGRISVDYYAIVICVPRKALYKSVQQLRSVGGSGVLVSPVTYIFEEETPRWRSLLLQLGL